VNAETLKRLAVLLAALVVVWLGVGLWRRAHRDTERRFTLARFDPKAADRLVVARPTDTLHFEKLADGWTVNGHRTGAGMVDEMLAALADTTAPSELVAENASSLAQLGLDSTARRVTVSGKGTRLLELLVGRNGDVYGTVFVRKPGDVRAYSLKSSLGGMMTRSVNDWRDKVIASIAPDSVASVRVQRGARAYTLAREGKAWRLGGAPADTGAVTRLLEQYRELDGVGFPTAAQADSLRFDRPARVVRITGTGGQSLLDLAMDSAKSTFWARRAGDSIVYRIDPWTVAQLAPADTALKEHARKQ